MVVLAVKFMSVVFIGNKEVFSSMVQESLFLSLPWIYDGLWASSTNFNKEVAFIEEDRRTEKSRERPSHEMGDKLNISREE